MTKETVSWDDIRFPAPSNNIVGDDGKPHIVSVGVQDTQVEVLKFALRAALDALYPVEVEARHRVMSARRILSRALETLK
ncbi:hypothetical protein EVB91_163 [Rhizobium phage RHph_I1_18]|nr:hypothetical protein EVB91_163 [Rhizobium phage RHph_I1_18]